MKFFPLNKDTISLSISSLVAIGFFVAGLSEVLDYFIIKALLFMGFGALFFVAIFFTMKNNAIKNRPEDKAQDDLH